MVKQNTDENIKTKVLELLQTSGEEIVLTPTLPGLPVYGKNKSRKRTPNYTTDAN